MDEIARHYGDILNYCSYIVDGRFEQDKLDLSLAFRGSTNQKIWNRDAGFWKESQLNEA